MIVKMIFDKVKNHLETERGLNTFNQSGLRLCYVVYQAYITSDQPIRISSELLRKAHELINDGSSYGAFERSVYRELRDMFSDEPFINIVSLVYKLAKETTV